MSARPVTWDLDIPPASLLEPTKKTRPAREVPSLDRLRAALTGTRFEVLKVSTFAAFLLTFVGVAIERSRVANPDNQFVANTEVAAKDLAGAASDRIVQWGGSFAALNSAIAQEVQRRSAGVGATAAGARATTHVAQVSRIHCKLSASKSARSGRVALQPRDNLFDLTNSYRATLADLSLRFESLVAPDSLIAGLAALILYLLFVFVLVHAKGGLRAFSGSHAV